MVKKVVKIKDLVEFVIIGGYVLVFRGLNL